MEKKITDYLTKCRYSDDYLIAQIRNLEPYFNEQENKIRAFLPEDDRFSRLFQEAALLHDENKVHKDRPPLFGLLIGVKDIFHIDGFPTKAGSTLPADVLTGPEAFIIEKIKRLGALVVGKTITTEFAYFAPGPTRNPHNLKHTPGGSSSGSAAAVAAGLVPFAFGSQTIGSVIRPASYCGVVGFKPTFGRVSTEGIIPLAPSVDTVGFFASNAMNAAFLCSPLINGSLESNEEVREPVIGIPIGPYLNLPEPEMKQCFTQICGHLREKGIAFLELPVMDNFNQIYQHHNNLVAYEAALTHNSWYSKYNDRYHLKTIELIHRGQTIAEYEYKQALESRLIFRETISQVQKMEGIDLWISPPALGSAPRGLNSTGDPIMNLPWTHGGFPTLCLPAGKTKMGLPLGVQISAAINQDLSLLNWAVFIDRKLQ